MTIDYRMAEYGDFDIERVVEITRAIRPDDYVSVAEIRDWHDAQLRSGRLSANWLVSVDGSLVGSAYVGQSTWLPPTTMVLFVLVHPDYQGRGFGREILERAEATATEGGAEALLGWAERAVPRTMQFLERAGFREVDREWESTLDLSRCDIAELQQLVDRATSSGVRIVSAGSLAADRADWKHDLHRLYTDIEMDVPTRHPVQRMPFDDFNALSLGRQFLADGFFVALDGNQLVGLTEPTPVDDVAGAISQSLTGVRSDYRGRGIASALKAQTAVWAIKSGYTSIRTENAQSNAAMLAVNDRLGFERDHATIEYFKNL
jgi:GNAT superfamily N-acetyltransferase